VTRALSCFVVAFLGLRVAVVTENVTLYADLIVSRDGLKCDVQTIKFGLKGTKRRCILHFTCNPTLSDRVWVGDRRDNTSGTDPFRPKSNF
jgi:hypothetical protein